MTSTPSPELQQQWDILSATIEYLVKQHAGGFSVNGEEPLIKYFKDIKARAEQAFKKQNLPELEKQVNIVLELPRKSADLEFENWLKEKIGPDINIFRDLRAEIEQIIAQNSISSDGQHTIVFHFNNNLRKQPGFDVVKADKLQQLLNAYVETRGWKDGAIFEQTVPAGAKLYHKMLATILSPNGKCSITIYEGGSDPESAFTNVSLNFIGKGGAGVYSTEGTDRDLKAYWKDDNTAVIEAPKEYFNNNAKIETVQSFGDIVRVEIVER